MFIILKTEYFPMQFLFKSDFLLNENIYKKLSEINTDNLKNHDIFDIMIR